MEPIARSVRQPAGLGQPQPAIVGPVDAILRLTGPLEPRAGWTAADCSVAAALDLLSTRTAFLLLREAFYGATRFDEFVERVGVSEPVASARLRELVDHGLLAREEYRDPGQRARLGYVLTKKGAGLLPVLVALMQWGDRWVATGGGPVEVRHRGCRKPVHVELRCSAGHPVDVDELDLAMRRRPAPRD
jgi:DNA-binding HxlR family transcriptional regulator